MMAFRVRFAQSALCGLGMVCASLGVQAGDQLTVHSTITEGSCELSMPASLPFYAGVRSEDFVHNNWTAATRPLVITIVSCKGSAGKTPAVQLSGETLAGYNYIFADGNSEAANGGFMVREGTYTGALGSFFSPTDAIPNGGFSHAGSPGEVWSAGKTLAYTVGFVSAEQEPAIGMVSATLTFGVKYR